MKILDYKIVLGEYIWQFFVDLPWELLFVSESSNLNKIKKAKNNKTKYHHMF